MKPKLRIIGSSLAGCTYVFDQDEITLGRHPQCHVAFHPEHDLDVSGRHATILLVNNNWVVRDLGSSNGTLVNGYRISSDTRLEDTDVIRLGPEGPKVEIRMVPESTPRGIERPDTPPAAPTGATPRATRPGTPTPVKSTTGVTQRVRAQVAEETRKHRVLSAILGFALIGVGGGAWYFVRSQGAEHDAEVAALQRQIDSVLVQQDEVVRGLEGQVAGLASALATSQDELESLRNDLERARESGDRDRLLALRQQLAVAMASLAEQRSAARIDYESIRDNNQRAVGMVYVRFRDNTVVTGTAFAVRDNATMITNRHVVAGADGSKLVSQVAIQFADSEQFFPGEVLLLSDDPAVDLAVIRVRPRNLSGTVPTVQGLNLDPDTIPVGAPVAMIGFPLGTELPMQSGEAGPLASTSLTAGIVSKNLPGEDLQINGYGAVGASGSPIFDASGDVIGVLFAGNDRLVFAVPSTRVTELMERVR